MTDYMFEGLLKRRATLTDEIERTHENLRKMVLDLEALDAVILQVAPPDFKVETIKPKAFRPPADWAHRGEMSRIVLSILRQAVEPMSTRDIAVQMLIERALDKSDQRLIRLMTKRVGVALRGARDQGLTKAAHGTGQFMLWEISR
ncbi:MAG TPA: hypothetical protein VH020_07110 [Stellaceae bacterium]|jgi:hypothetical protein|nr:hypothetical protein [Stellaceae bacterium]